MNLWKLVNGQYLRNWDHPQLVESQELAGPAARIMSAFLERLEAGPCQPTTEETLEMQRLAAINYGY